MKRAVLITGHFPRQRRRASMLWVSDHLQEMGWHVTHVTVGYSWLSLLKRDARLQALDAPPRHGTRRLSASLTSIYGLTPLHPFRTTSRIANRLLEPAFGQFARHWRHRLAAPLAQAHLVICESGVPALLGSVVSEFAPQAARIYRVNDDIGLLNAPDILVRAERAHRHFTRISTASPHLAARFATHPNVTLDPMGIPHERLKVRFADPYIRPTPGRIAVCAGTTQLDVKALARIAAARPGWHIHVLGRLRSAPPTIPGVTWHGEQPFDATLARIAHADIGLAPYVDGPGVEYQTTNSNRILLYRHHGLPTLGPDRLCHRLVPSIIGYSAPDALKRCENWCRMPEDIPDWSELASSLAQNGVTDPPSDIATVPERIVKPRVKTVPALASSA